MNSGFWLPTDVRDAVVSTEVVLALAPTTPEVGDEPSLTAAVLFLRDDRPNPLRKVNMLLRWEECVREEECLPEGVEKGHGVFIAMYVGSVQRSCRCFMLFTTPKKKIKGGRRPRPTHVFQQPI